ncbi:reverse transcriptase/maturase family protein [Patescibacteria group bacterium]|nr:reverse transcriptase/maturase family protein [Patescibacteria group bacterium]
MQKFGRNLSDNIFKLHSELINLSYRHGSYYAFNISDPKPRNIHKACVRDRLIHHTIYRQLYPFFDSKFIHDSYSCRIGKGTHRAMNRFRDFGYKVSKNNTRTCWVLKCDIRKFFASVDHEILLGILRSHIPDLKILWLLSEVISSFSVKPSVGLPLGNLTSQLLVNIYMNELDQFAKHQMKAKYYIRYADDFVLLSDSRTELEQKIPIIRDFLISRLKLTLHPNKVFIKTLVSGVDFLGWVHFPDHRVLRTTTKRRMVRKMVDNPTPEAIASYLGLIKHGNTNRIKEQYFKSAKINHSKIK